MKQLLILQVNQQERHAQQMRKDLHVLNENIDRILGCMRQPKGNVDQIAQIEAQIQHAHAETQRIVCRIGFECDIHDNFLAFTLCVPSCN
jgi:hypothetical protein